MICQASDFPGSRRGMTVEADKRLAAAGKSVFNWDNLFCNMSVSMPKSLVMISHTLTDHFTGSWSNASARL